MGIRRVLVRGSFVMISANLLVTLFGLLRTIAVARILDDPDLVGLLAILSSLRGIFVTAAAFGIPTAIAKYYAEYAGGERDRATRLIQGSFSLSFILSVAAGAVMFLTSWLFAVQVYGRNELIPLIQIGAVTVPISSLRSTFAGALRGLQRISRMAALGIIESAVSLIASVALVIPFGVVGAAYAILAGALSALVASLVFLSRDPKGRSVPQYGRPRRRPLVEIGKYTLPLFISGFVVLPALWLGETVLALRASFNELGLYRIAYGFYDLLTAIPALLAVPLMPMIAELKERDPSRVNPVFSQTLRLMMFVALPPAVAISLSSSFLLHLFYGEAYVGANEVMSVLVLTGLFISLSPVTSSLLLGTGRTLAVLLLDSLWAAMFVPVAVLLILTGGVVGLGYAHLTVGLTFFAIKLGYLRRAYGLSLRPFLAPLLVMVASMLATIAMTNLLGTDQRLLIAAPAGGSLAVLCLLILKPGERRMLGASIRDVFGRGRKPG